MLDVVFRKQAKNDLLEIRIWFETIAPESVQLILTDIFRSIERLR